MPKMREKEINNIKEAMKNGQMINRQQVYDLFFGSDIERYGIARDDIFEEILERTIPVQFLIVSFDGAHYRLIRYMNDNEGGWCGCFSQTAASVRHQQIMTTIWVPEDDD